GGNCRRRGPGRSCRPRTGSPRTDQGPRAHGGSCPDATATTRVRGEGVGASDSCSAGRIDPGQCAGPPGSGRPGRTTLPLAGVSTGYWRAMVPGWMWPILVYAIVLGLHLIVPARWVDGYVRDAATGKPLRYR